ncbi:MAG TPA: hypothetical protein VFK33_16885 [Bacillales bacterium]|nr:hypothetical protein [Bacillales bacterium]
MAEQGNGVTWQEWLSWAGIVIALIGFFFWAPVGLGVIGAILGIFSLSAQRKTWVWIAIIVGIIVIILGLFGLTVA